MAGPEASSNKGAILEDKESRNKMVGVRERVDMDGGVVSWRVVGKP